VSRGRPIAECVVTLSGRGPAIATGVTLPTALRRRHFMAGLAGALTFGSLADEASAELPGFKKDLSKRRRVTIPR